ncbi:hypothetical protein C8Q73DRAFT_709592 [Cubamyces lactineus]|nr:hypothetical protein C8Q73DRAFT_709592 [Cubamyces lactineus]
MSAELSPLLVELCIPPISFLSWRTRSTGCIKRALLSIRRVFLESSLAATMPPSRILSAIGKPLRFHRRRRRTLEDLPVELLQIIFCIACTDGGRTGCSLSRVSKRIRAISLSTRFHSVALVSGLSSKLTRFATTFERACVEAARQTISPPIVRHLCISVTLNPKVQDADRRLYIKRPAFGDQLAHNDVDYCEAKYRDALAALFRKVGTSQLQSLVITGDESWGRGEGRNLSIPCPDGFPLLRELAFTGFGRPPFVHARTHEVNAMEYSLPAQPLYPVLTRLVMSPRNDVEVDFEWWARHAPRLEVLHIMTRGPVQEDMRFLPNLKVVLSRRRNKHPTGDSTIWPKLREVVFGYHARLTTCGIEAAPADRDAYINAVRALSSYFDTLGPLASFAPSSELQDSAMPPQALDRRDAAWQEQYMRIDWELRLNGHRGLSLGDSEYRLMRSMLMLEHVPGRWMSMDRMGVVRRIMGARGRSCLLQTPTACA